MVRIYADRLAISGWGEFWVGVYDNKVVYLELPPANLLEIPSNAGNEPPKGLTEFAHKWGLSLELGATPLTKLALEQVRQYLSGNRREFELPLQLLGTDFQLRVWQALLTIPWGEARTYRDMADILGNRGLARAVGQANSRNPISIIVPCHRVVATDGLGGYGGGLNLKQRLLKLEGVSLGR
ncbi:MAG: methylated-DNA--[protein]-cysteine S-methyltransferase [Firmicutes bacterium]|jgi:O-6-methylguanine DNA methyltransferase|nr:methylated-DNA--[protein]-cysteine S-methyltransferase [Bacillota bacterium]